VKIFNVQFTSGRGNNDFCTRYTSSNLRKYLLKTDKNRPGCPSLMNSEKTTHKKAGGVSSDAWFRQGRSSQNFILLNMESTSSTPVAAHLASTL
jgi:hypothetical protein